MLSAFVELKTTLPCDGLVKVHLVGSETFDRVRFVGFTNTDSMKTRLPYELNGMVILEDKQKRRFLVRAKAIRMIVVEPENEARDESQS